jgi:pimeloyl-ACP methyl ester carboxylesterase
VATFCLVHGAWHDDACWELLVAQLECRGHECVTPVLPLEDAAASYEDYAAVVVECLRGREAPVLVGHSMSSAVTPLVAVKRRVRLLIYLCPAMGGFPPPPDEPPYQRVGYERPPVDADDRSWWPHDRAVSELYGRLDTHIAERLAARLRPQPQAVFSMPYPLTRPPDPPSAFLYARKDELFDDDWSRWIARRLLGVDAIELPGGHFPMLEHPATLADLLEQVSSARVAGTGELPDRKPPVGPVNEPTDRAGAQGRRPRYADQSGTRRWGAPEY